MALNFSLNSLVSRKQKYFKNVSVIKNINKPTTFANATDT